MPRLYSLMEKNYSLGIFQLGKCIDFIAKVSDNHFLNLRVKYKRKSKMIICSKFTHIFQKIICYLRQVGQITPGPNFFSSKIVKTKGIIPKFHYFQDKNRKFAAVKKNPPKKQVHMNTYQGAGTDQRRNN